MAEDIKKKKDQTFEFMGPIGTFFLTFSLPIGVLALFVVCNKNQCSVVAMPRFPPLSELWNNTSFLIFVGWFLFHALIYLSPLGYVAEGTKLRDGQKLKYNMNGIHAYVISHVLFVLAYFVFKVPVSFVYDHYLALAVSSMVFSFALSVFLYVKSFTTKSLLSEQGDSGYFFYDFFMGRELNPRTSYFDWKVFCEMRPGLIGWVLINYCMLVKEYELRGTVSLSMILVALFQAWYILDALWMEEAILTTMDVIHEGFGFMLAFGDLAWVPFTYSLQARFLVDYPVDLPLRAGGCIFLLNALGFYIFRSANATKNRFRSDPNHPSVSHLKTLQTKRGTKLIISGMWGFCRHPNYVGDLIMALSWSLPCGFTSPIPYFYVMYFAVLLIHRQLRDEAQCRKKYGEDWDKYCKIVRWRLVPGIY